MVQSLEDRDKERAQANKAKKVLKRPAAADDGAPLKRPASTIDGDGEELTRFSPPCWGNERSRLQIMCRTGFRGLGQSHRITYDDNKLSFEKAKKKADL